MVRVAENLAGIICLRTLPAKSGQGEVVTAAEVVEWRPSFRESIMDANWDASLTKAFSDSGDTPFSPGRITLSHLDDERSQVRRKARPASWS